MRKIGYIVWAVWLVSCSENSLEPMVPEQPDTQEYVGSGFSTGTDRIEVKASLAGADTRAAIDNLDALRAQSFGMYAYFTHNTEYENADFGTTDYTNQPIMINQQMVWKTDADPAKSKWDYYPSKFWPGKEQKLSFFAYAPYIANAEGTDNPQWTGKKYLERDTDGIPQRNYAFTEQDDILWGTKQSNDMSVNGTPMLNITRPDDNKVPWLFIHGVARVKFLIYNYERESFKTHQGDASFSGYRKIDDVVYVRVPGVDGESTTLWRTYNPSKFDAKLLIEEVKLKNVYTTGELVLKLADNTIPYRIYNGERYVENPVHRANWQNRSPAALDNEVSLTDAATGLALTVPESYKYDTSKTVDELKTFFGNDNNWETVEGVDENTVPIFSEPYIYFIPKEYSAEEGAKNLQISIKYRYITRWELTETRYEISGDVVNVHKEDSSYIPATVPGVSGLDIGSHYESTATLNFSLLNNHSYVVSIRLGKMQKVDYVVEDWGVEAINLPVFE